MKTKSFDREGKNISFYDFCRDLVCGMISDVSKFKYLVMCINNKIFSAVFILITFHFNYIFNLKWLVSGLVVWHKKYENLYFILND